MFRISTEMIDYQRNDSFPEKMDQIVIRMLMDIKNEKFKNNRELLSKSKDVKNLEKLVFDRLGILIEIDPVMSEGGLLAIVPHERDNMVALGLRSGFMENLDTKVTFSDNRKRIIEIMKERKESSSRSHNKEGWVNTKLAKVGGYLSEVKHYLIINMFGLIRLGITPQEITAGIIHELGHAFGGLEYHHRVSTTNITIASIIEDINGNKPEVVFHRYRNFFKDTEIRERELRTSKDVINFSSEVARAYIKKIDSEFINAKYDQTSFENIADSFAGRFGRSQDIATCLEKLYGSSGNIAHVSTRGYYVFSCIFTILLHGLLFYYIGGVGFAIGTGIVFLMLRTSNTKMTYDFPLERISRLRGSVVNYLKLVDLGDELTKNLLKQYEVITGILTDNYEVQRGMSRMAKNLDIFGGSNARYVRTQQTIESILNNELFVTSAKIRVL